jgi:hypothetical protein
MKWSPSWRSSGPSSSQKISRCVWNPVFRYCFHRSPISVPILIQMSSVHALQYSFINIQLRTNLPLKPRSFRRFFIHSFFLMKFLQKFIFSPKRAVCPTEMILIDKAILYYARNKFVNSSFIDFMQSPITSSLLVQLFWSTVFSRIPSA